MFRNKMFDLMARNKGRGTGPRAATGNTIYLYDVIVDSMADEEWLGGVSAERIVQELAQATGPVTLRIDSPGGSVFGGRAIANAVRTYADGVHVIIDGLAASAASYVATSAAKVSMVPGAFMMIHRSWTIAFGNCVDFRGQADVLEKIDGTIADSYAARAGGDKDDWLKRMEAETWLTAAEAVELGLADEAMAETIPNKAAANRWDVSMFDSAPDALKAEAGVQADELADLGADAPPVGGGNEIPEGGAVTASTDDEIAARQRQLAVALL